MTDYAPPGPQDIISRPVAAPQGAPLVNGPWDALQVVPETAAGIVYGHALQNSGPQTPLPAVNALAQVAMGAAEFANRLREVGPAAALAEARNRWNEAPELFPAEKALAQAPFDPLNLPVVGQFAGKVLGAIGQGIKGGLEHVPAGGAQITREGTLVTNQGVRLPQATQVPAENLWELLTTRPAELIGKQRARVVANILGRARQQGGSLTEDAADLANAQAGTFLPQARSNAQAYQTLLGMEGDLWRDVVSAPNPRAGLAGLEIIAQTEEKLAGQWESLLGAARGAAGAKTGGAAASAWQGFWARGFDDTQRALEAAQTTYRRMVRTIGDAPADPALQQAFDQGLQELWQAKVARGDSIGMYLDKLQYPNQATAWGGIKTQAHDVTLGQLQQQAQAVGQAIGNVRQMIGDPELPKEVGGRLAGRLSEQEFLRKGLPGMLGYLPEEQQGTAAKFFPAFVQQAGNVTKMRQRFEDGLQTLWELTGPGTPYPRFDPETTAPTSANWLSHFNDVLSQLPAGQGQAPVTGATDFFERYGRDLTGVSGKLEAAIRSFPGGDLLQADPYELVFDRVIRQHLAQDLGVRKTSTLERIISDATSAYKSQALLSGAYPAMNVISQLLMGGLEGINPARVLGSQVQSAKGALRGEDVANNLPHIRSLLDDVGLAAVDKRATAGNMILEETNPAREFTGIGRGILQKVGAKVLSPAEATLGAVGGYTQTPSDADAEERLRNTLVGAGLGAAAGAVMPTAEKYLLQRLGRGIEDVGRTEAWYTGMERALQDAVPALQQIAEQALGAATTRYNPALRGSVSATGAYQARPASGVANQVLDQLKTTGGRLSPDDLLDILTRAGAQPAAARQAMGQWRDAIQTASDQGVDLANKVHFDYADLNNTEQFLARWLPFSTWAVKAFPFFGEHMLQSPVIANTILKLEQGLAREKENKGLTQRFTGLAENPILSAVYGAVLDRPLTAYVNPLNQLVPFSGIARLGQDQENAGPLGALENAANAIGLPGLNPLLEIPLRTLTPLMGDEPARGVLRWGGPLQGATALLGVNRGRGIDLNGPQVGAENAVQQFRTGREAPDLTMSRAMNRLDEIMARQGIAPDSAEAVPFIQQKAQQRGPLWDQAMREVSQERGLGSLLGLAANPLAAQATLTPEEAGLRQAQIGRLLKPEDTQQISRLLAQNPDAVVPPELVGKVAAANAALVGDGSTPELVQVRLENPTARNVHQVVVWIEAEQRNRDPQLRLYQQSGNPDQLKLQARLDLLNSIPALAALRPGATPEGLAGLAQFQQEYRAAPAQMQRFISQHQNTPLQFMQNARDTAKTSDPLLAAYLAYQAQHSLGRQGGSLRQAGTGTMEDFFQRVWAPQARLGGILSR